MSCCKSCGEKITLINQVQYIGVNGKIYLRHYCSNCKSKVQRDNYMKKSEEKKEDVKRINRSKYPCSNLKTPDICSDYIHLWKDCKICPNFMI